MTSKTPVSVVSSLEAAPDNLDRHLDYLIVDLARRTKQATDRMVRLGCTIQSYREGLAELNARKDKIRRK